jgi:hypothetical protein
VDTPSAFTRLDDGLEQLGREAEAAASAGGPASDE